MDEVDRMIRDMNAAFAEHDRLMNDLRRTNDDGQFIKHELMRMGVELEWDSKGYAKRAE